MSKAGSRQFTMRQLLGIVFALCLYLAAWRMLGASQQHVFIFVTALLVPLFGTLYWLDQL